MTTNLQLDPNKTHFIWIHRCTYFPDLQHHLFKSFSSIRINPLRQIRYALPLHLLLVTLWGFGLNGLRALGVTELLSPHSAEEACFSCFSPSCVVSSHLPQSPCKYDLLQSLISMVLYCVDRFQYDSVQSFVSYVYYTCLCSVSVFVWYIIVQ